MNGQQIPCLQRVGATVLGVFLALVATGTSSSQPAPQSASGAQPSITITTIPPWGQGGEQPMDVIGGTVSGVDVKQCKVVIFTITDKWYVQPTIAEPDTPVQPAGRWETDTHLGHEYAALLVKPSYRAPATLNSLPAVGGDVLAIARVRGRR